MHSREKDKIQEALELLNEAAQEKSGELFDSLGNKYAALRDVLLGKVENGRAFAEETREKLSERLQDEEEKLRLKAKAFDKKVRRNPWPFLGAAALGALVIGVLSTGRK